MSRGREPVVPAWYRRHTLAQLEGKRFITLRTLRSGVMSVPGGTVVEVVRKRGGNVDLSAAPCPHCGVAVFMTRVSALDVEPEPEPAPPRVTVVPPLGSIEEAAAGARRAGLDLWCYEHGQPADVCAATLTSPNILTGEPPPTCRWGPR